MQYMAKWGPKGFLVSPNKVIPFSGFSTAFAIKEDSNNDTSGTAKTNTRGRELAQSNFETTYLLAAGVDPRAQIEEWKSLLGKSHPLIIGGKQFGDSKMKLTNVSISDVLFTNAGKMIQAKVSITLKEDGGTSTSKKTSTTSKSSSSGSTAKKTTTKTEGGGTTANQTTSSNLSPTAQAGLKEAEDEAMLALGASKTRKKTTAQEEAEQAQREADMALALASTASYQDKQDKYQYRTSQKRLKQRGSL